MAFLRSKIVNGKRYYQLVENERVDGKHKQRVLMHLGRHKTVEAAIADWTEHANWIRRVDAALGRKGRRDTDTERLEEKAARLRSLCGD